MRINSKEELQSKKAEIEQNIQNFTCRVLVCSGTGCMASSAQKIYDEMVRLCEGIDGVEIEMQKDIPHVGVIKTGCQGLCELGPLVRIEPYGYQYVHVQEEDCLEIVCFTAMEMKSVRSLRISRSLTVRPGSFLKTVVRLTRNPLTNILQQAVFLLLLRQLQR